MLTGLLILISVGIIWTTEGTLLSGAARHGINTKLMQCAASFLGILILVALILGGVYPSISVSGSQLRFGVICYLLVGILAFLLRDTMARAMMRGPNSLVWAILQSGMLIPFLYGIFIHHVKASSLRYTGMAFLLIALALMSQSKQSSADSKKTKGASWIPLSFLAFAICGIQQTINSEPSYIEDLRVGIPIVYRSLLIEIGSIVCSVIGLLCNGWKTCQSEIAVNIRKPSFWGYSSCFKLFGLLTSLLLQFRAMDHMAKLGQGAISYPVMVTSCIVCFTLYSLIFLKERFTWQAAIGILCCITGIVLISM